jgi:hypothetical protein
MKNIFLLVAALLFVNILPAQYLKKTSPLLNNHKAVLNGLLQQSATKSEAMKTTSVTPTERVIAQSTHDSLKVIDDSVFLGYRLYHTSTYDYNTMIYAYDYPYSASPVFNNAKGIFAKPQVQFDTFMHWAINPNNEIYCYYETAYASYDAGYNMIGYLDLFADSTNNPNVVHTNKFTAAKNIDTAYSFIWKAGVADSAFKQLFTYNGSNLVTKDSTYEFHLGAWHIVSKSFYTYDVSNNLVQIDNYANNTDTSLTQPLVEQLQYINTYDASHRLLTVASSFFSGLSLSPYIIDTFAYTGAYTFHSSWREYQYDPINAYWAPMTNMTKVINGLGEPDTVNIQGFDSLLNSWVPQTMDVIKYNSFKDPDTLQEYDYNYTNFPAKPSYTTVYYYGTYTNKTGVNNVAVASDNVKIYPNPANNSITISNLGVPLNSRISVLLLNMYGQIVSSTSVPWQNETQISLGGLIPGVYGIVIQGASGNILHRQAIIKQ